MDSPPTGTSVKGNKTIESIAGSHFFRPLEYVAVDSRRPMRFASTVQRFVPYALNMRIDFIITELNVGGAEKALTEIAIGMSRLGHQVRVLAIGPAPVGKQDALLKRLRTAEIPCVFGGFQHWWNALTAVRWLREQLRANPPELVQTFLFHANCIGIRAGRKEHVPHLVGGLRVAEAKPLRGLLERHAVRSMSRLVCVSEQVERFAHSYLRASSSQCVVIPNGVDAETIGASSPFDWTKLGWDSDVEVALFVGRLHPQKGLELIQQQTDRLLGRSSSNAAVLTGDAQQQRGQQEHGGKQEHRGKQEHGRKQAENRRIVLIGEGPLRASLTEWAERLGDDRVRILPWQSDIPSFLKASKLLILPSHYEGMPNVVLEAMAAGLPVVCSQIEGTDEIFGQAKTSGSGGSTDAAISTGGGESTQNERRQHQLFPAGDSQQMAVLVERLFTQPALCKHLGNENRRHVVEHFSIEAAIRAYESLYESVTA